jgi:hypothetical protein
MFIGPVEKKMSHSFRSAMLLNPEYFNPDSAEFDTTINQRIALLKECGFFYSIAVYKHCTPNGVKLHEL